MDYIRFVVVVVAVTWGDCGDDNVAKSVVITTRS